MDMATTRSDYHELIDFMKSLRTHFRKNYGKQYKLGSIYKGSPDYSYFSMTSPELKKLKLKYVIVLNHTPMLFNIGLSGQNGTIRQQYCDLLKGREWAPYDLSISGKSLLIINHDILERQRLKDSAALTQRLVSETMTFIKDINEALSLSQ